MFQPAAPVEQARQAGRRVRRARLLLVLAAILWSLAGIFIKFITVPPLALVFYRSLFASLFFSFFIRKEDVGRPGVLLLCIISYTAAISSFVSANRMTTAANAIILQYTAPLFVFVVMRFVFRETIARVSWIALVFGMAGIAVIFVGTAGEPDGPGVMLAIASGFLFSIYMVCARLLASFNPGTLTWLNNVGCCALLMPFVSGQLALSAVEAVSLGVMGIVQLGLPYWLFSKALQAVAVHEAALIVLIEPILNPIWVALAFGEVPSVATVVGGSLIGTGLIFRYGWTLLKGAS